MINCAQHEFKTCNAGLLIPRVSLLEPLELICEEAYCQYIGYAMDDG